MLGLGQRAVNAVVSDAPLDHFQCGRSVFCRRQAAVPCAARWLHNQRRACGRAKWRLLPLLGSRAGRSGDEVQVSAAEQFGLGEIRVGDVVVHEDHGIAVVAGLAAMPVTALDADGAGESAQLAAPNLVR